MGTAYRREENKPSRTTIVIDAESWKGRVGDILMLSVHLFGLIRPMCLASVQIGANCITCVYIYILYQEGFLCRSFFNPCLTDDMASWAYPDAIRPVPGQGLRPLLLRDYPMGCQWPYSTWIPSLKQTLHELQLIMSHDFLDPESVQSAKISRGFIRTQSKVYGLILCCNQSNTWTSHFVQSIL